MTIKMMTLQQQEKVKRNNKLQYDENDKIGL